MLQQAGELPSGKISVKIDRYSMGCSLTVRCEEVAADVFNPSKLWHEIADPKSWYDNEDFRSLPQRSEEGERIQAVLEAVVAPYHRDDSDSMSDYYNVNFAKTIDVCSSTQRAIELKRLRG